MTGPVRKPGTGESLSRHSPWMAAKSRLARFTHHPSQPVDSRWCVTEQADQRVSTRQGRPTLPRLPRCCHDDCGTNGKAYNPRMTTTSKPRRRWFQFSLRLLLVFTLVVSVAMGWIAVRLQQIRRERGAIAAIKQLGGAVSYGNSQGERQPSRWPWLQELVGNDRDSQPDLVVIRRDAAMEYLSHIRPFPNLILRGFEVSDVGMEHVGEMKGLERLFIEDTRVTDHGLEHLRELRQVENMSLRGTQVTDAGLQHLRGLIALKSLILDDTQVTDAGLQHLKRLPALEYLSLNGTQVTGVGTEHLIGLTQLNSLSLKGRLVTDSGLKHIGALTQLRELKLMDTRVTDAGLQYLTGLTQLRTLNLIGTQVTDAGLETLQEMPWLTRLLLGDTQVSDGGVTKLQQTLLDCVVDRDHYQ